MSKILEFIENLDENEVQKISEWVEQKRREQIIKEAEEKIEELTEKLASEIYDEMQKDASVKSKVMDAYRAARPHLGTAALGVGAIAGVGAMKANTRAKSAQTTADALAYGLAAETSADIRSERMMANEMMRNRKAIITMARAMQAARGPQPVPKIASEPKDLLAKIVKGLKND